MSTLTVDTPHTGPLAWVYQIPVPQTKIVLGIVLTTGTFMWAWFAKAPSEGVLGILLGFCATLFGITHFDYKVKRETDVDLGQYRKMQDQIDALLASLPKTAEPAPAESVP